MTKRTWHKGPPPHVGWWNASISYNENAWRWWNGRGWSYAAMPSYSAKQAATMAAMQHTCERIKWTNYWPKNARVPRIKHDHQRSV